MENTTTPVTTVDNTTPNVQAGDRFVLTGNDIKLLAPWLQETLATQAKDDENSDLCQLLTELLRYGHTHHGTAPATQETCICYGG
ncbi:hypothetical protein ACFRFL_14115 [Streptomyces sp. NPDC056708]|uniref:hypothetical protein n=1 Tax=unclassified Streptomyces TaxID=2593676 RepID=UPI0036A44F3F